MSHNCIIDLPVCTPVGKWNTSIKANDQALTGLGALSEMKFLILLFAWEPSCPTLLSQPYILPVSLRIALFSVAIFSLFALSFPLYSFSLSDLLGFPSPLSRPVLLDQYTPHLLWQLLAVCLLPVSQPGSAPAGERAAAACLCPSRPQGKQLWWALMHYWSLSPLRIYLLMHTRAQLQAHINTLGPD